MVWSAEELGLGVLMLGAAANAPRHPSDPGTLDRWGKRGGHRFGCVPTEAPKLDFVVRLAVASPSAATASLCPAPYGGIFLSNPGEPSPQTIGRHSGPVTPSIQLRLRAFAPLG